MLRRLSLVWILFLFCAGYHHFLSDPSLKNQTIAVLPFSGVGFSETSKNIIADELTTYLFIEKRISVIDRSQVNYFFRTMNINHPYILSRADLIELCDSLRASVAVLGFISKKSFTEGLEKSETTVTISLRFLHGKTGRVLGIIHQSRKLKSGQFEYIRQMLREMVGQL